VLNIDAINVKIEKKSLLKRLSVSWHSVTQCLTDGVCAVVMKASIIVRLIELSSGHRKHGTCSGRYISMACQHGALLHVISDA